MAIATRYRNPVQLPRRWDCFIASDRMGNYEVDRRRRLDFLSRSVPIRLVPLNLRLVTICEADNAQAYRFDPARNAALITVERWKAGKAQVALWDSDL